MLYILKYIVITVAILKSQFKGSMLMILQKNSVYQKSKCLIFGTEQGYWVIYDDYFKIVDHGKIYDYIQFYIEGKVFWDTVITVIMCDYLREISTNGQFKWQFIDSEVREEVLEVNQVIVNGEFRELVG